MSSLMKTFSVICGLVLGYINENYNGKYKIMDSIPLILGKFTVSTCRSCLVS